MSLKTKLGMAVMSSVIGATMIAGGTFAYFTSTATNSGNSFAAGTVIIGLTPASNAFNASNMAPGGSQVGHIQVRNTGTLAVKYEVQATNITNSDAAYPLSNILNVAIYQGNLTSQGAIDAATPMITRTLNQLNASALEVPGTLASGSNQDYTFVVTMPVTANNDFQGDSVTGDITFTATQTTNPGFGQ